MTGNLVRFTIITFATATWSLPPFNAHFKPSLHERHNDDIYAANAEIQPRQFLENRKFLSRRFIYEPDRDSKRVKQPCEMSLFQKMEDILILLKRLLLQGSKFAKSLSEQILIKDTEKRKKNCDTIKKNLV